MDRDALIELIIQERLSEYFKQNVKRSREDTKKADEFLLLLKEKAPELEQEFLSFLDYTAEHGGDEQEGLYLFGFLDGIRLMKDILHMG